MQQAFFFFLLFLFFSGCVEQENKQGAVVDTSATVAVKDSSGRGNTVKEIPNATDTGSIELSSIEKKIAGIRQQYNRINSLPLTVQSFEFTCDVKDSIHYYLHQGQIVKIVIDWGFIGDGQSLHEYYYKDNKLMFVFKKHTGHVPGGGETVFEQISYVHADETIRYMENAAVAACVDCSFTSRSKAYRALGAFATKGFKAALCN